MTFTKKRHELVGGDEFNILGDDPGVPPQAIIFDEDEDERPDAPGEPEEGQRDVDWDADVLPRCLRKNVGGPTLRASGPSGGGQEAITEPAPPMFGASGEPVSVLVEEIGLDDDINETSADEEDSTGDEREPAPPPPAAPTTAPPTDTVATSSSSSSSAAIPPSLSLRALAGIHELEQLFSRIPEFKINHRWELLKAPFGSDCVIAKIRAIQGASLRIDCAAMARTWSVRPTSTLHN